MGAFPTEIFEDFINNDQLCYVKCEIFGKKGQDQRQKIPKMSNKYNFC